MPQISVYIKNDTSNDYNVHAFDLFANGQREVGGSPFALAGGETSPAFAVNASSNGRGTVGYSCDGGPSLSGIDVGNGDIVSIQ